MEIRKGTQRVREGADAARRWGEQTIFWRIWERLLENEFIDRSVALAAKAFVSLFPAIIVVASFTPDSMRGSIKDTIINRAGLNGYSSESFRQAFATSDDVRKATGIAGLLFTFFYINSFTTALRRVYTRAWRRPPGGRAAAYAIGASWLVGVIAYFSTLGLLRWLLGRGPATIAFGIAVFALTIGVWLMTSYVMLQRQVRLRVLVSSALLTATGMSVYALSANVWMPRTVSTNQEQFGLFGVAIALVTWLTGACIIIVISAVAGPVLAEDPGTLGRLVRGGDDAPLLKEGAAPALPAPERSLGLLSAIGVRTRDDEAPGEQGST